MRELFGVERFHHIVRHTPLKSNDSRYLAYLQDQREYGPKARNSRVHIEGIDPKQWRKSPWNLDLKELVMTSAKHLAINCSDPFRFPEAELVDWEGMTHKRFNDNIFGHFRAMLPRFGESADQTQVRIFDEFMRKLVTNRARSMMSAVRHAYNLLLLVLIPAN
jgi:hypothetical protein